MLLFSGLILLQNNFSTAAFVFLVALALFFVANVRIFHLALIASILLPLALMLLFTREHRLQRVVAFLDPARDPSGASFQVLQARMALSAGGLWGRGLGLGGRKLGALPEAHSDFIFAVVGEELGLLGMLGVLVLFVLLAARGYADRGLGIGPLCPLRRLWRHDDDPLPGAAQHGGGLRAGARHGRAPAVLLQRRLRRCW